MGNCSSCPDFQCANDIQQCALTLNIGDTISDTGEVTIYIEKNINGSPVVKAQAYNQSGYGDIILDLTFPSKSFYNSFDGLYKVWVTNKADNIEEKLTLTAGGVNAKVWAFNFVNTNKAVVQDNIIPA